MKMEKRENRGEVKLHNVKFYNIVPRAITFMSYNQDLSKLGVVRQDASIEIWSLQSSPFLEKTIPGGLDCSVESIGWSGKRLFSVGLMGDGLIEWNLKTLEKKKNLLLTGSAAFCLDIDMKKERIAVGTEEGYINIFDITDDDIQFIKILDKQEGRIICCKFDHTGQYLVTGSLDAVRVWNIENGHAIHKMGTGRTEAKQETIVWCLEVLKDFTILSGDSRGRITVWDGNLGCQTDYIQALKNDVLCLAVSPSENAFYCSGVEQILKRFTKLVTTKENHKLVQWVRSTKRSTIHTHDVRAMVCIDDEIVISGGVDGFLAVCENELKVFEKFGPFLQCPFVFLAEESRRILFKYPNYLEVWKLGTPGDDFEKIIENVEDKNDDEVSYHKDIKKSKKYLLSQRPLKLLQIRSKNDENILCCSISPNSEWIIYSTKNHIRLFRFLMKDEKPALEQVKEVLEEFTPCQQTTFSRDSKNLFIVKSNGNCSVFDVDENFTHLQTFEIGKHLKDYVHLITISPCSQYLAFAGVCNNISVWKVNNEGEWNYYKNLPKYKFPVTSMAFHPNSSILVVAFSNQKLFEYNLEDWEFQFSTQLSSTNKLSNHAMLNLCLDPRNQNVIIFQRDNKIFVLNKNPSQDDNEQQMSKKKKKTNDNRKIMPGENFSLNVVKEFKSHLVHLDFLRFNEIVAVEVNSIAMLEHLPAPMKQKKFGIA